jgi:hypothetical protein
MRNLALTGLVQPAIFSFLVRSIVTINLSPHTPHMVSQQNEQALHNRYKAHLCIGRLDMSIVYLARHSRYADQSFDA